MSLNAAQHSIILQHAERLLNSRDYPKTICPSEIARALTKDELETLGAAEWRDAMDDIRRLMWGKRDAGDVEVLQKGEVVNVETLEEIKGPIRLRKVQK